jgi:hemin uptake protein HemP
MMKEKPMQATAEATEATRGMAEIIPTRSAQELLGERGILRIEHEGEVYTLRITRNNRLILTK